MNKKDPWIHPFYFALGSLQIGNALYLPYFPFYPTSAVSCREIIKCAGQAQEAVMKEEPREAGGAARSPCSLSVSLRVVHVIQPGWPSGQGPSKVAMEKGRE